MFVCRGKCTCTYWYISEFVHSFVRATPYPLRPTTRKQPTETNETVISVTNVGEQKETPVVQVYTHTRTQHSPFLLHKPTTPATGAEQRKEKITPLKYQNVVCGLNYARRNCAAPRQQRSSKDDEIYKFITWQIFIIR